MVDVFIPPIFRNVGECSGHARYFTVDGITQELWMLNIGKTSVVSLRHGFKNWLAMFMWVLKNSKPPAVTNQSVPCFENRRSWWRIINPFSLVTTVSHIFYTWIHVFFLVISSTHSLQSLPFLQLASPLVYGRWMYRKNCCCKSGFKNGSS